MTDTHLTSLDNPLIKRVRQMHDARTRREAGVCLVEGMRAITACLDAGWLSEYIFITEDQPLPTNWPSTGIVRVAERVAEKISQAHSASGYLAIFTVPTPPAINIHAGGLVLVGVSDPGNLGTLIRCAAAFALHQVVLVGGADPFTHKVVQSTAGTLASVQLYRTVSEEDLVGLLTGATCCALVVRDGQHPAQLIRKPRWLIVGSEAHGLSAGLLAACQERLTLPMPGQAESLNAAMAGAIACYALFAPGPNA